MTFRSWLNSVPPARPTALTVSALSLLIVSALSGQTTFTVNTVDDADDGTCDVDHCSLREAITAANHAVDGGIIQFNIAGAGPHTIQPTTALPAIVDGITLDGTTEPDFAGTPVIELN